MSYAQPNSFSPCRLIEGDPEAGMILLCDHARNGLPAEYGTLGLDPVQFERHIAYDPGAEMITERLAERLGCPAVLSTFSRLLIDPNRGLDDPTLVMRLSDGAIIPQNHPIDAAEIQHRIDSYYTPYHALIERTIDTAIATGRPPMIFSIHTFTPFWKGQARPWHGAILWDADSRLARPMIDGLQGNSDLMIGDNQPYDGGMANDTLYRHATSRGLADALVEVRQDLCSHEAGAQEWADRLAVQLESANANPHLHEIQHHGSRSDRIVAA
ncbi:N-formylglutamate amidohydrolase [Ahrensia sp. R2A130]|uniref:N-formylglutamate amidohydrolase n=1 Tax=Ahrensia sp. R2A130 TaxID=744979 RepID=UPI0001E0CA07|nr:N-formylglutamate amidohydrolase [Ahrensia sp. R2A130]EFL88819.1 N-formylglutamate amidohydrolase [Ahrensia sp. R2A130]